MYILRCFFVVFFLKKKVKFRKPVVPGDTLVMEVEVKKFREKAAKTEKPKHDVLSRGGGGNCYLFFCVNIMILWHDFRTFGWMVLKDVGFKWS